MNGWHRLWIFVSILLAALIGGAAFLQVAKVRPRISESTLAYLEDSKPATSGFDPSKPLVEVDTGRVIIPPGYENAMNRAAEREAQHQKWIFVCGAFVAWIVVCIALLGLGHGTAWVIRGFSKRNA